LLWLLLHHQWLLRWLLFHLEPVNKPWWWLHLLVGSLLPHTMGSSSPTFTTPFGPFRHVQVSKDLFE
jgi:hypothetical protein